MWRLGLAFAGASITYWSANAFIPDYLHATGRAQLIEPSLTVLNAGQLPGSFLTLFIADRFAGRRDVFVSLGVIALASLGIFLAANGWVAVAACGFLGFATSFTMVMVLALPPMVAEQHNVHRISAGIYTVSYCGTFLGNLLAGALWDVTHVRVAAFIPAIVGSLALSALGTTLRVKQPNASSRAAPRGSR
jgi:CP family cyanate transporter-like MFS transporter